jgi:hypothetical protein
MVDRDRSAMVSTIRPLGSSGPWRYRSIRVCMHDRRLCYRLRTSTVITAEAGNRSIVANFHAGIFLFPVFILVIGVELE